MSQKLKIEVKQWIKEDQALQLLIAQAFLKRNIVTVQRWVKADSLMLTHPLTLETIRKHKGLKKDFELLELREPEKSAV